MKQAILKFTGKKFITATFLSAALLVSGFAAKANSNVAAIEILSDDNSSVEFTGSTSDALLFKVHISNEKAENFTLTIKNENGEVLFSKDFSDVSFEKQIKILKNFETGSRYYFNITSAGKDLNETYVINAAVRTVDDVAISKL